MYPSHQPSMAWFQPDMIRICTVNTIFRVIALFLVIVSYKFIKYSKIQNFFIANKWPYTKIVYIIINAAPYCIYLPWFTKRIV